MAGPDVIILGTQRRTRTLWVVAATLFLASAALFALQSMPGSMDSETLTILGWLVTAVFALACISSAAALWPGRRGSTALRGASVASAMFAVWTLINPLVLTAFAGDTVRIIDALLRIVTGGIAVGCVFRSSLRAPWRVMPMVVFSIVVVGSLLAQVPLTTRGTMDLAIFGGNLLILTKVGASVILGLVALQFARLGKTTTPII